MAAEEEGFSPLALGETSPGNYSLTLTEFDRWASTFEEAGQDGGGYGWVGVADALIRMKAKKLRRRIHYDPEASMFVAFGKDREALVTLARLLLAAMADPAALLEAIENADPELMD
jgi:hypothetical protein